MDNDNKDFCEEITFTTLLLSLISSTLVQLGELPHPETNKKTEINLTGAKQGIDTLSILAEKTRGNLNSEEESLFINLLSEVKMHYSIKANSMHHSR